MVRNVDQTALKVDLVFIIGLLLLALVTNSLWLLGAVGGIMVIGVIWPEAALFKRIYQDVLEPAGLLSPVIVVDDPEPLRFAQGVASLIIALAILAIALGFATPGWALTGLVVVMAGANLALDFRVSCAIFAQLASWGVPGFEQQPVSCK